LFSNKSFLYFLKKILKNNNQTIKGQSLQSYKPSKEKAFRFRRLVKKKNGSNVSTCELDGLTQHDMTHLLNIYDPNPFKPNLNPNFTCHAYSYQVHVSQVKLSTLG
jgi:hypothetical protein